MNDRACTTCTTSFHQWLLFTRRAACCCFCTGCWLQPCFAPALPVPPQVRIISFGVMLFLPMTLLSLAVLLPINYTSDFYLYMGVRHAGNCLCLLRLL